MMDADIATALAQAGGLDASSDYDLNAGLSPVPKNGLRDAAVLVPLVEQQGVWHVILTKRPNGMKHHPGQVAFPGGKVDPIDPDLQACALREAHEEIGLPPQDVTVIGALPSHETVTGFQVYPFVGVIPADFVPIPEVGEVEEAFSVPLSHVIDIPNYQVQSRRWAGQDRYFYTVPYGPYYIWGATARMLRSLASGFEAANAD